MKSINAQLMQQITELGANFEVIAPQGGKQAFRGLSNEEVQMITGGIVMPSSGAFTKLGKSPSK